MRRLLGQWSKHKTAVLGLSLLVLMGSLAVAGKFLYDKNEFTQTIHAAVRFQPPSGKYWLGTDNLGRDIFAGICIGASLSLSLAVRVILFALVIGVPVGALSAYFGSWLDALLMRLVDIVMAFPTILLALTIMAWGRGPNVMILAIGIPLLPVFIRQVRAAVLVHKNLDYVAASRALGAGHGRILCREILPNALSPIIVVSTLSLGAAILDIAGLSFLGLGVPAGEPEWGTMLNDARHAVQFVHDEQGGLSYREWWAILFPGLAIALTVLGFNLFGDGLRDHLDPRLRKI